ncbi:hypothetical protein FRB98_003091 [Tulasnella sp. 332]|nr:hypothetical protein FRB98_003091 [Tulasnella sp. 332]
MSGPSSAASSPKPRISNLAAAGLPEPANRHAPTPLEQQRIQLAKLLRDPTKNAFVPKPGKEKSIRPPREMMKNVQGSSAGAGSGEFHVYKQNRRREYERIKLMDEKAVKVGIHPYADAKDAESEEFERRKLEREETAEAKTAKNRAKRQKKKDKGREKGDVGAGEPNASASKGSDLATPGTIKKRRLADGSTMVFRRPDAGSEDEDDEDDDVGPRPQDAKADAEATSDADATPVPVVEEQKIIIHDDD